MNALHRLSLFTLLLAFCVIVLGAYTRLSDAGLGCPDWPGCYGQFTAPTTTQEIQAANHAFPQAPVHISKAQTEMTHRYFAESLGCLIIIFALFAYLKRKELTLPRYLAPFLVALVLFQGLLGMWTVTLKLLPLVVMAHLLGGFGTLSLLWLAWLYLQHAKHPLLWRYPACNLLKKFALITLLIICLQIALGGWTSTNYAALVCPDFPLCQGKWWPTPFNFAHAFNLLGGIKLANPLAYMGISEKTLIHISHRLGALISLLAGSTTALLLWLEAKRHNLATKIVLRRFSLALFFILLVQISLGIANVMLSLPLSIAVLHNATAAILLLCLIALNFTLSHARIGHD